MPPEQLKIRAQPKLRRGRMVLAFSGWMDGGNVSTGTVEWLVKTLDAYPAADIDPEGFYIYSFPGSMEISAMFRPHTRIEAGVIKSYDLPSNEFYCDDQNELLLFSGREPNFNWNGFADCLFSFASKTGISELFFIGSVGGAVPHTREPRLRSSVSDELLKSTLEPYGVRFVEYEGPAAFSTELMVQARARGFHMASLVAEVPVYIQGTNPKSIEAILRKLAAILGLRLDLDRLRKATDAWEQRLNDALENEEELSGFIRKLEHDYDNEVFDTEMGDLKDWLEQRGIRVD